jgi:hypothetical protein
VANIYLQFSEVINNLTEQEAEWAKNRLTEMTNKFSDSYGEEGWDFEWEIKKSLDGETYVWMYSEESSSPEHVVSFAQEFLKRFRPDGSFAITWASFCDKPRVGEFDGGGAFVTANSVDWFSPSSSINAARHEFEKRRKKENDSVVHPPSSPKKRAHQGRTSNNRVK